MNNLDTGNLTLAHKNPALVIS